MNQLNIFGEIDYIDDDGNVQRCEICGKSIKVGDVCSDECAKIWIIKYLEL